jgi:tRNA-2-methylthio-N6-dimethylallyladenosine synthase
MLPLLASNAARIRVLRTPVQSGSDRILALMRRGYTSAEVTSSLGELLKAAPSLPLETHVLVGFPGETDEDFQKTIELLKQVAFVKIQVYQYTDRPGTPASDMVEKVSDKIKESRIRHLLREFPQAAFYSG